MSIIYSLSYRVKSIGHSFIPSSFIELGYVFSSIEIPGIRNIPAPDLLLINKTRKIVIALECKSDVTSIKEILKKFSNEVESSIRILLEDKEKVYVIEYVLHTFDIYAEKYEEEISKMTNKQKIFLWSTTARSQVLYPEGYETYTLRKHPIKKFNFKHTDEKLEEMLSNGIAIKEDQIVCNPLLDINPPYRVVFFEVIRYISGKALSLRGQEIPLKKLVEDIKQDYQSPISREFLFRVIKDVLKVFDELAELKSSESIAYFKKKPKLDAFQEKYDKLYKEMPQDDHSAKRYIRNLIER